MLCAFFLNASSKSKLMANYHHIYHACTWSFCQVTKFRRLTGAQDRRTKHIDINIYTYILKTKPIQPSFGMISGTVAIFVESWNAQGDGKWKHKKVDNMVALYWMDAIKLAAEKQWIWISILMYFTYATIYIYTNTHVVREGWGIQPKTNWQ